MEGTAVFFGTRPYRKTGAIAANNDYLTLNLFAVSVDGCHYL
jgi:hypothetical protein